MFYMGPCFLIFVVFCSFVVNLGPTAVRLIKTFKTRERLSYIHNNNDNDVFLLQPTTVSEM